MTHRGKIARLPLGIRDQLNRRLQNGEPGKAVVNWLNGLPEAQAVVASEFGGKAIRQQNLSDWKKGGYQEWLRQEETLEVARQLGDERGEIPEAGGPLADKLAVWLAARYVVAARRLASRNGDDMDFKLLRALCNDLVALRRGDHRAARLEIERKRRRTTVQSVMRDPPSPIEGCGTAGA